LRRPSRWHARDPRLHLRLPGPLGRRRRRDPTSPESGIQGLDEHDDLQGDVSRRRDRDDGLHDQRGGHRWLLIAPGYQYSQIDPALTMTRDEHREKFRVIRAATKEHGYRWIASPIYQDFLTGQRELTCAPWGSITRNPYGWKGPCYLLTDGIFPTYEALLEGMDWEAYGPGNDPRCEHCGIHCGFEPSAAYED